jgi:DNA-binding MarR family transcriptional regulator
MMADGLDDLFHQAGRFRLCAVLYSADGASFAYLRTYLGISDSLLSKHLRSLQDAGYVSSQRRKEDARPYSWWVLTGPGRSAFSGHLDALQAIAAAGRVSLD